MAKQLTTFVIDLASCMTVSYNDKSSQWSNGLLYFYYAMVSKLLKGRVTDFVSVVLSHCNQTNHLFGDDELLQGINVITRKKAPTLQDIRQYEAVLMPHLNSNQVPATAVEALLVAVAMMSEDTKGSFIRNIVVITDCNLPLGTLSGKLALSSVNAVNSSDINVTVVDLSASTLPSNKFWSDLVAEYNNGKLINAQDVSDIVLNCPPLKRVDPRSTFKGSLRLGSNPSSTENDPRGITLDLELYPAVRSEKLPSTKNFLVKNGQIKDLTTTHQYYVTQENEAGEEPIKKTIGKGDWKNGYRYTNKDIHVLEGEASHASKLECFPSIDVIGTININDLPLAYFTEDSYYSVPSKFLSSSSILGYNCLCEALIEQESLLIVRYVQKENSEIKICAMIPCKALISDNYVFALQMIRLPFKEDEKIGRFPPLSADKDIKHNDMEKFILSRSLDDNDELMSKFIDETSFIQNDKLGLITHEDIGDKISSVDGSTSQRLLSQNPAINKFHTNLIKIIRAASTAKNYDEFVNDPEFITKHLVSEDLTNLFNLTNILHNKYSMRNKTWLWDKSRMANKITKKLSKQNKPFKPKKKEGKARLQRLGAGNFGENEDDLELVDVDALFE